MPQAVQIVETWQFARIKKWLPVVLGLVVLYAPTVYDLNATVWNEEDHAHGPIVLMAALWMLWRQRDALFEAEERPATLGGSVLMLAGLFCYILGRSQLIIALEVGSSLLVVTGAILFASGPKALRATWFPIMFLAFMIPLPGVIIYPLTGPLREYVSVIAERSLHAFDYPIARSGVILTIGSYQLLVANACSGINSMFALMALGLLYLYLMRYRSASRNVMLLVSILPIAFAANIIRVLVLVLVTYYFGDETGQGVIHGSSGMALFIIALLMLFMLDALLGATIFRSRSVAK